jgi:dTDP-3-amino-3,4,6-trideoxy-alpha-D-glucose transaminase
MNVPFLELRPAWLELRDELDAAFHRVMDSGRYLFGPELEAFEAEFAGYCGAKHCVGVGNGLDALHLTLRALGIGRGDEVIVPAQTFIATWLAVSHAGAVPVGVDVDPRTANLDPALLEAAITPRTRAIIPVHLYGQPADMDAIAAIATRHGLAVIEDAAQAHGARHRGRRTGSLGHAAAFSFYPAKNLGAFGDAGAVVTNDGALADKVRLLRNYGSRTKYVHELPGFNSRIEELHAALLRVRLRHLDEWNARRQSLAARYIKALEAVPGLSLPAVPDWAEPVWHLFVIRHPRRHELAEALAKAGIGTQVHYPVPPPFQTAYEGHGPAGNRFPSARRLAGEVLSLPLGPHLKEDEVDLVATCIRNWPAGTVS